MKDYKILFERSFPVENCKPCNEEWEVEATLKINKKMATIQREFSSKSELSQTKVAGFHFTC